MGVSCSVRCGCSREKCQSRHLEKNNIVSDIPEEEEEFVDEISDKENANIRDTEVLNIVPIMKSKRIVAPKATVRELADMEMSFASQNILNKKTKAVWATGFLKLTLILEPLAEQSDKLAINIDTVAGWCICATGSRD